MRTLDELGISPAPWKYHKADGMPFYWIDGVASTVCGERMEADARLIAAAPRLYEALREAVIESCHECMEKAKCCPHESDNGCFVTKWRDALAAASGESEVAK